MFTAVLRKSRCPLHLYNCLQTLLSKQNTTSIRTVWAINTKFIEKGKSATGKNNANNMINEVKQNEDANVHPVIDKKRQVVLMEIEVFRQCGDLDISSEELTVRDWKEILELSSPAQRKRYYSYVMKRRLALEASERRRKRRIAERVARENEMNEETAGHIRYGLSQNTMYFRLSRTAATKVYNSRLAHAVLYGQKLVLDLDYNQHMRPKDIRSCVEQIKRSYRSNAKEEDPFHLYFCNARPEEPLLQQLHFNIPKLAQPHPLTPVTDKNYLDIFPKNKLVYLTPDCQNDLVHFDHDAVYIIGCFVDMAGNLPISLAKAKQEGLKMARLPIQRYVKYGGNRALTIDQVISILLTIKTTGDWVTAFQHLPKRKEGKNCLAKPLKRYRAESLFGPLVQDECSVK